MFLLSLREVGWVCMIVYVHVFLFGFGIGMMFASFHVGEVCESKWSYVLEVPE